MPVKVFENRVDAGNKHSIKTLRNHLCANATGEKESVLADSRVGGCNDDLGEDFHVGDR